MNPLFLNRIWGLERQDPIFSRPVSSTEYQACEANNFPRGLSVDFGKKRRPQIKRVTSQVANSSKLVSALPIQCGAATFSWAANVSVFFKAALRPSSGMFRPRQRWLKIFAITKIIYYSKLLKLSFCLTKTLSKNVPETTLVHKQFEKGRKTYNPISSTQRYLEISQFWEISSIFTFEISCEISFGILIRFIQRHHHHSPK